MLSKNLTKLGYLGRTNTQNTNIPFYDEGTPSLDLHFAGNRNLVDNVSGNNLVTFTRASSGTFVNSAGVIQTSVTNLFERSEEFENAYWTKTRASVSSNATAAPNGATTADKLVEDATASNTHQITRVISVTSGAAYTWSIYCKAAERSRIVLSFANQFPANSFADFNLSTGTIASTGALGASNVTMQPLINGWYRIIVTATASSTASSSLIAYMSDGTSISYTGDGTSGLFLWGAQLEQASTVGEYIPTAATINSAPRFDHNPTTLESLGLLVEEQRTNSLTNNTMVGAVVGTPGTNPTGWLFVSAASGLTQQIIGVGIESGISYIDYRFSGTTTTTGGINIAPGNGVALTGQTWNASTYWKLAGGSNTGISAFAIGIIEETLLGTFVAGAFYGQTAPTSASLILQRPTATRTLSGGATVGLVRHTIQMSIPTATAIDITIRIGMPQLEQGAFATSVIPTSTAAVTRSADVASITGTNFSSWYNQSEGALYTQSKKNYIGTSSFPRIFQISDTTNNNSISNIWLEPSNTLSLVVRDSANLQAEIGSSGLTQNIEHKSGMCYKLNDIAISNNGNAVTTDTSAIIPTVDRMFIGKDDGNLYLNGTIKRISYFPTRLSDTTLQNITR